MPLCPDIFGRVFVARQSNVKQMLPGVKFKAEISLMDFHEHDGNDRTTRLLREQKNVLDAFTQTWVDRFAPCFPFHDIHGGRLRLYISNTTKVINPELEVLQLEEVDWVSRDAVFSCCLHSISYEWDNKCQKELVVEAVKVFLMSPPDEELQVCGEDEIDYNHITHVLNLE
ncbi:hypothetical protein AAF712_010182 [Marasmius tenuissimus]|uniref:Uncharacterized protein n=1 Tax=Marasmius tenuissimus TaxID=585030 RepID=A0ABR2ZMR4_9AGAR